MGVRAHRQRSWHQALVITMLTGTLGALQASPVRALTPYVYTPSAQELEGAGVGIGRTAAQLLRLGQPEEAARLAALAVRLQPNDERLWSVLAEAQLRSDQLKAAAGSLAKAKALKPGKAGLWFAEASIALRDERPDDAVSLLDEGLRLDPDNAGAYFDLGNARVMQSDLRKALKAFEQATAIKPSFWEALNNQALVLFEMGNTPKRSNAGAPCCRSSAMQNRCWLLRLRSTNRLRATRNPSNWLAKRSLKIPTTFFQDISRISSGARNCARRLMFC